MACKQLTCEGMSEFQKTIEAEKKSGKSIFVLFTGKEDSATGNSWCPDCVEAEPIIEECIPKIKAENSFIVCVVGDRATWKDPQCAFRTNPQTKLKGIPTLMKWDTAERLNSDECAKADIVTMLFTDE